MSSDNERLARIEVVLTNIEKRLFGNGHPGELGQLHTRLDVHNKRLTSLEMWRWWIAGVALGLGIASGIGISQLIEGFTK